MQRIIRVRGTNKTHELMNIAKEQNAIFICADPYAMQHKAEAYGVIGVKFDTYDSLFAKIHSGEKVVIDELENLIASNFTKTEIVGYSLTNED